MSSHPAAQPHGEIAELFPDVFLVRGTFAMNAMVGIARNMVVLREGDALTLVNPIRLSEAGERALEALGAVRHLVQLGPGHTTDLPYVRERFGAPLWAAEPKDATTEKLVEGSSGPLSRAEVFRFRRAKAGESALVWKQPMGNLLVTCDSVQNWVDTEWCNWMGGLATRAMGFIGPAKLGPFWLKAATGGRPWELRPDFDRLLALEFRHLIAGHGVLLRDDAHGAIERSVARQLPVG
jgi:hypothetical protein